MGQWNRSSERHASGQVCRCRAGTSWTLREEPAKYAPDRTCDVTHLRLEARFDLPKKLVRATVTHSLSAVYGPFDRITLDAVDLEIESVRNSAGKDLAYTYFDDKLVVRFPRQIKGDEQLEIRYQKQNPSRGLYFWGPGPLDPKATWQMWSQGEDEENRHWIPCHDAPNEKMTTETIVTVPQEYAVLSNGELRSARSRGKQKTWHHFESVPHTSYLLSLVIGEFSKLEDDCDGLPVHYYVEAGREEEGWRSFGKTPAMIRHFSNLLACPFPYEKYAQAAVRHFIFGGMENISATTQTDGTLHDERAAIDASSDSLVSHELAHQWFGDLLTCKHWAHAWLNEGFATYFECLWREHGESFAEFEQNLIDDADSYKGESYRRAIVNHRFAYPIQMFDMHLYPKGGWVLHMLRRELGDELFWKSIRLYVKRHAASVVETIDLMRAFEDATGRSLERFFQQWLYSPGHPELEGSIRWNEDDSALEISLKQAQVGKEASDSAADSASSSTAKADKFPLFHVPIEIEVSVPKKSRRGGAKSANATKSANAKDDSRNEMTTVSRLFRMTRAEQSFAIPLPEPPRAVVFDPNARLLKSLKLEMSTAWLEGALLGKTRDTRVFARVECVRQSVRGANARIVKMLRKVLETDPFWGVRAAAAEALGKIRSADARDALLGSIETKSAKARLPVIRSLGLFADRDVHDALATKARQGDESYLVEAEAHASYARVAQRLDEPKLRSQAISSLRKAMRAALKRNDWHDRVAVGIAQGMGALRDEAVIDDILGLATDPQRYWRSRLDAFGALAELGASRPALAPRIMEAMIPHLDDPELLLAFSMPPKLSQLGTSAAIPALRTKAETTPVQTMKTACLRAIETLSSGEGKAAQIDRLQSEVRTLTEETRSLRGERERKQKTPSPTKRRDPSPPKRRDAMKVKVARTRSPGTRRKKSTRPKST